MSEKSIDEYEYEVDVHEVDPSANTVHLIFREVDGRDGFGVTVDKDTLESMLNNGTFDDWSKERIMERISTLKRVEAEKKAKRDALTAMSSMVSVIRTKRIKVKAVSYTHLMLPTKA